MGNLTQLPIWIMIPMFIAMFVAVCGVVMLPILQDRLRKKRMELWRLHLIQLKEAADRAEGKE